MQFLPPSRAIAHFGSANCPAAYQGLKIITSLALRFPDFQRLIQAENTDRINLYHAIAKANDHPEWFNQIKATFALSWVDNAQSGWWYQASNGHWKQK